MITSFVAMAFVFGHTLSDYLDSRIVINIDADISNKNNTFPAVSICMKKRNTFKANNERIKKFVQNYYSEHNIEEPQ